MRLMLSMAGLLHCWGGGWGEGPPQGRYAAAVLDLERWLAWLLLAHVDNAVAAVIHAKTRCVVIACGMSLYFPDDLPVTTCIVIAREWYHMA